MHLDKFGEIVKEAVREAGGVPFMFNTIGVDDGIAMGHFGMKYSLPSREIIADSRGDDGQRPPVRRPDLHPQLRQDRARHADGRHALQHPHHLHLAAGRCTPGQTEDGTTVDLISVFEAVGVGVRQAR